MSLLSNPQQSPQENASNFESLHEKITGTEERLTDINDQTQKKFQIVRDNVSPLFILPSLSVQLSKIQKQIEEERSKFDSFTDQKNNYIKILENKINERFNQESELRKEIERRFSVLIDDKFNALKIEISKESRNRYECIENLKTYLENDFPKLQGLVKFEQGERQQNDEAISKKILDEINKLQSICHEDKKTREETEEAILEMLRVMITKMKSDVENERKDREITEETLLSILEDTCNKLNAASQI